MALVRIGTAVGSKAGSLWLRSRRDDLTRSLSLVELAGARGLGLIPQRRLERQFDQLADAIATRLEPFVTHSLKGLDPGERDAALDLVAHTLTVADLSDERLLSADLNLAKLQEVIYPYAEKDLPAAGLSQRGTALFWSVLDEAIAHLTEVIATLPSFQERALQELLSRDSEIIDMLRSVLDRMPARDLPMTTTAERFELDYRRDAARRLDQIEIFGVTDLGPSRQYSLSVSYIGLSVVTRGNSDDLAGESRAEDNAPVDGQAVSEIVNSSTRVFIRGEAGSGKTTLLQWLALRCAQGEHEGALLGLNQYVPFLVELRKIAGDRLPLPEELPLGLARMRAGRMPAGWAHDRLEEGRALVLVDGVDEVEVRDRERVRRWLTEMVEAYPNARYVVTSRPAATTAGWLSRLAFESTELLPMTRVHIESFVNHWHDAVALNLLGDELSELESFRRALHATLANNSAVRTLATNPLMCALLCALNRDRRTQLPSSRIETYRTALEMLLTRRDHERGIPEGGIRLDPSEKLVLLEDLAHWFTVNGLVDADAERVVGQVERRLRQIPTVRATAEEVYGYLLVRSGVLRQPRPGRASFIHKTFQEYLAAKRIVDTDSLDQVLRHATSDAYREVITMAAGHARPHEAGRLVNALLDKADAPSVSRGRRSKLVLLAIACVEMATELGPDVRRRCLSYLESVMPPQKVNTARIIAAIGEDVLPRLPPGTSPMTHASAVGVLRTAALIGGPQALDLIGTFRDDARPAVMQEKVRDWSYFEPVEYARAVFGAMGPARLRITDPYVLPGIPHVHGLAELHCTFDGDVRTEVLERLAALDALRSLTLRDNGEIRSLSFLAGNPGLAHLALAGAPLLSDVRALSTLPGLGQLSIDRCPAASDVATIAALDLHRLEMADLTARQATRFLQSAPALRALTVHDAGLLTLEELPASPHLEALGLRTCRAFQSFRGIGGFAALTALDVEDCPDLSSLSSLEEAPRLRHLTIRWCYQLRHLDVIGAMPDLQHLKLEGSNVGDVRFLVGCRELRTLSLKDCDLVRTLAPLAELPNLRSVRVSPKLVHQARRELPTQVRVSSAATPALA
jgi:NACHT domain